MVAPFVNAVVSRARALESGAYEYHSHHELEYLSEEKVIESRAIEAVCWYLVKSDLYQTAVECMMGRVRVQVAIVNDQVHVTVTPKERFGKPSFIDESEYMVKLL